MIGGNPTTLATLGKATPQVLAVDNTRAIGRVLYTQYFYLFQVAGVVLLVLVSLSTPCTSTQRQIISNPL